MGESPDSVGDGEEAKSDAVKAAGNDSVRSDGEKPAHRHLPVVWSPKLDAGESDGPIIDAAAELPNGEFAKAAPDSDPVASEETSRETSNAPARRSRFILLAASVAVAAVVGSFAGALTASGIGRFLPANTATPASADAKDVLRALKAQLAELSSIRADLDNATRNANGQFAKITDRLDHVERAQIDPGVKLAHIADTVDRLDKQMNVAPETTGSIKQSDAPAGDPKLTDRILEGWVVHEVQGSRALIESRYGGIFDVGVGSVLPGVGRVDAVKRQDGQWVVVTARGIITSGR